MSRIALMLIFPLFLLLIPVALTRYLWAVAVAPDRAKRIALGFDQLGNATTNGSEDETISSRAAYARDAGKRWGCLLCRLLDRVDADHCNKSKGI